MFASLPAVTRRSCLQAASGCVSVAALNAASAATSRPKIAAVFTELRFRSHAYNFLINLMGKYLFRGQRIDPGVDIVSFYADQFPEADMARDVSRRFQIPLYRSIDEALCLDGNDIAVDGVLLIGEHGNYPTNDVGQRMYPRKQFWDQIVATMRRGNRFVPVFNDKHLSYRWDWSKSMYDEARELGIPLLAGSSVPLAQRVPPLEVPAGVHVEEAVSIHGGGIESYDFHALEVMQSFLEARPGGETGVSQVQLLGTDQINSPAAPHRWSESLVDLAMDAEAKAAFQRLPYPGRSSAAPPNNQTNLSQAKPRHALLVHYKDGTRGMVLAIGNTSDRWNVGLKFAGQPPAATALYNGPWGNLCLFTALSNAVAHFFKTKTAPYPIERTLLVSGILDAAMRSHHAGGQPIATPHLEFSYQPQDFSAFRETGQTWQIITKATPQPTTFEPYR